MVVFLPDLESGQTVKKSNWFLDCGLYLLLSNPNLSVHLALDTGACKREDAACSLCTSLKTSSTLVSGRTTTTEQLQHINFVPEIVAPLQPKRTVSWL